MGLMNAAEAWKMMAKYEADTQAKYMAEQQKIAAAIKKQQDEFDLEQWFRLSATPQIAVAASAGKTETSLDLSEAVWDIAEPFLKAQGFKVRRATFQMRYSDETPEHIVHNLSISWA
jgi:hypothetical protein